MVKKAQRQATKKRSNKQPPKRTIAKTVRRVLNGSLRNKLPSALVSYFDFVDGKPSNIEPYLPARHAKMASQFTANYRFMVSTATNQPIQILANTTYLPDATVMRGPTPSNQYYAVSWGALPWTSTMTPGTLEGSGTLVNQVFPMTSPYTVVPLAGLQLGNCPGYQRIKALKVTVRSRQTAYNNGGEVFILHTPYTNNVAGMTSNVVAENLDTRRYSLLSSPTVNYSSGPTRNRHEFIAVHEWANQNDSAAPADGAADPDVFGDGHAHSGASTHFGAEGYKGWDLGIVIAPSDTGADASLYEVTITAHYDIQRTRPTLDASQSIQFGTPLVPSTFAVPANSTMVDLMDSAHSSLALQRSASLGNDVGTPSIWPHVEKVARHVLYPLLEAGASALMS